MINMREDEYEFDPLLISSLNDQYRSLDGSLYSAKSNPAGDCEKMTIPQSYNRPVISINDTRCSGRRNCEELNRLSLPDNENDKFNDVTMVDESDDELDCSLKNKLGKEERKIKKINHKLMFRRSYELDNLDGRQSIDYFVNKQYKPSNKRHRRILSVNWPQSPITSYGRPFLLEREEKNGWRLSSTNQKKSKLAREKLKRDDQSSSRYNSYSNSQFGGTNSFTNEHGDIQAVRSISTSSNLFFKLRLKQKRLWKRIFYSSRNQEENESENEFDEQSTSLMRLRSLKNLNETSIDDRIELMENVRSISTTDLDLRQSNPSSKLSYHHPKDKQLLIVFDKDQETINELTIANQSAEQLLCGNKGRKNYHQQPSRRHHSYRYRTYEYRPSQLMKENHRQRQLSSHTQNNKLNNNIINNNNNNNNNDNNNNNIIKPLRRRRRTTISMNNKLYSPKDYSQISSDIPSKNDATDGSTSNNLVRLKGKSDFIYSNDNNRNISINLQRKSEILSNPSISINHSYSHSKRFAINPYSIGDTKKTNRRSISSNYDNGQSNIIEMNEKKNERNNPISHSNESNEKTDDLQQQQQSTDQDPNDEKDDNDDKSDEEKIDESLKEKIVYPNLINVVLPDSILMKIFSNLDIRSLTRCSQVCRHWLLLARHGSNWQYVNLRDYQTEIKGRLPQRLAINYGEYLKYLNLEGCQHLTDHTLKQFTFNCPNIEFLNLSHCTNITDGSLISLSNYCRKLIGLNIDSCNKIGDHGFRVLCSSCKELKILNISWCDGISGSGLFFMGMHCCNLIKLLMVNNMKLNDSALKKISQNSGKHLLHMNIMRCSLLTNDGIRHLANNAANLTYLNISYLESITDESLISISKKCRKLKTLEASSCTRLTDSGFSILMKVSPQLEYVDIEECENVSDETLRIISDYCSNLRQLNLSRCEHITDNGVKYLSESKCIKNSSLLVLDLDNCVNLSDQALSFIKKMTSLRKLEIFDCNQISEHGIDELQKTLPNLQIQTYFAPRTPRTFSASSLSMRRFCSCRNCCSIL
ncbi:hypothetical protein SNEBB_005567 [Seison nebaliae]|nr:hypothetical protein SNEBB_005567 [Seison nebaliae]